MAELSDYVDLTEADARVQWSSVLARQPRMGRFRYLPIETVLCYGLFLSDAPVVDPHRYGGANLQKVPQLVHDLSALLSRPANSITSKMLNLDGSFKHGAKCDVLFFGQMAAEPERYLGLYRLTLRAARQVGIDAARLPDFLRLEDVAVDSGGDLFPSLVETKVPWSAEEIGRDAERLRMAELKRNQKLSDADTIRIVEHAARIGQRNFRTEVLRRFDNCCGFCGMAPRNLDGHRLIVASHVKPWAKSNNRERRDPLNGIAACPTHDAAFDTGLITVNGGLRVHRSPRLQARIGIDDGLEHNFGEPLRNSLVLPPGVVGPRDGYLRWHHENVYVGQLH